MSEMSTKARIIEVAIRLFNQHGIQNVRLQQIADEVGISVGNLAYHFHDKKKIMKTIVSVIDIEFASASRRWKNLQQLIDFDNHLSRHYQFLNTYSFYFLDVVDIKRFYPDIYGEHNAQVEQFIYNLTHWLEKNVERELLLPTKRAGQYADVSKMIWFIGAFWMSQKRILDEEEDFEMGFKKMIWQQIEPFFALKGKTEFEMMISPALYF